MMSEFIFSKVCVFILVLICSTNIQCQVERFAPLVTGREHTIHVDKKNASENEFHLKEFDIRELNMRENISSYYWYVQSALINLDDELPEPVEIILSDGKDVKAFKLPFIPWYNEKSKKSVPSIRRRKDHFCHDSHQTLNDSLRVIMNTKSVKPIFVRLTVSTFSSDFQQWKEDFSGGKLSFISNSNASVSQQVLKEFLPDKLNRFNIEDEYLLVQIGQPNDRKCLIATIQRAECPNSDFPERQRRIVLRQTMRTKAIFVIDPSHFPSGLVVTVTSSLSGKECCANVLGDDWDESDERNDDDCAFDTKIEETLVTVSITSNSSKEDYVHGILFILLFFLFVFVVAVTVSSFGFVYKGEHFENVESEARELEELSLNPEGHVSSSYCNYFISREDLESLGIKVNEQHGKRMKQNICLADLSKKMGDPSKCVEMYQKSDLHWRLILILSVFYSIPAFQLVIWGGIYFHKSSDQDFCYYNFMCLKPVGKLTAFNNVFSNIGYVCYGILFICLVSLKRRKFLKAIEKLDNFDLQLFGTPHEYSLFYGMGLALVMEGIMSACYHVCPTNIYFQFDTTYMYLIGILMQVKLYQNRHPDLSLGAIKTGTLLGLLLVFEAISYYEHNHVFWIIFCLIYLIIIMLVALHTYTLGALKYNHLILWNSIRLLKLEIRRALASHPPKTMPGQITSVKIRLMLILTLVFYNAGHVFYIIIPLFYEPFTNASSHILIMIMANLFIYTIFYITMKLVHKEYLTWSCRLYFVVSVVLIFASTYFFVQTPKNQNESAAISRGFNKECLLFNFYDSHDLWHFLSAGGLFSTFMFLLNIDEDLKYTDRRLIPVF